MRSFLTRRNCVGEKHGANTMAYLEGRYVALEKQIADTLRRSPTDDRVIADLKYRRLIIAEEIQDHRRLVERFSRHGAH